MFNAPANQEDLAMGTDAVSRNALSESDVHAMPDQYFQAAEQPKKKNKWILLGVGIFLILGGLIGGAVYFFSQQASQPNVNQPVVINNNQAENQNANTNTNENNNVNVSLDTAALRDMTRLEDISAIKLALASYFQTFGSFPNSLSDLVDRFLAKVPQNPTPGGQDYVYAPATGNLNYTLIFILENGGVWGIAKLEAGAYQLTAEGLLPQSANPDANQTNQNQNSNTNSNTNVPQTPSFVPGDGQDTDGDGLSDIEENSYKTNSTLVDTDGDTFSDANELLNFYDPSKAGVRLMDSGLIKVYQNQAYSYSLLYPADWSARSLSDAETIFTSNTGEFVSITVQDNQTGMSAYSWYLDKVPASATANLKNLTVDGIPAIQTPDGLNTYLSAGSKIFIITYNIGAQQQMNFKTTYQLFLKSFMFIGEPAN